MSTFVIHPETKLLNWPFTWRDLNPRYQYFKSCIQRCSSAVMNGTIIIMFLYKFHWKGSSCVISDCTCTNTSLFVEVFQVLLLVLCCSSCTVPLGIIWIASNMICLMISLSLKPNPTWSQYSGGNWTSPLFVFCSGRTRTARFDLDDVMKCKWQPEHGLTDNEQGRCWTVTAGNCVFRNHPRYLTEPNR